MYEGIIGFYELFIRKRRIVGNCQTYREIRTESFRSLLWGELRWLGC